MYYHKKLHIDFYGAHHDKVQGVCLRSRFLQLSKFGSAFCNKYTCRLGPNKSWIIHWNTSRSIEL